MNSAIIYRGPSRLDGAPILAIVTGIDGDSKNRKTGPMAQTWILLADRAPHDAARDGADASICGDCPLRRRPDGGRACYVMTHDAPLTIWRAARAGRYPTIGPAAARRLIGNRPVRLGAYGDPAAVPARIWRALLGENRHTGYSHQWRRFSALRPIVMASVESIDDAADAQARGWRTFRVRPIGAPLASGEIDCPAVTRGIACHDCGLCAGANLRARNISIEAHGSGARLIT